MKIFLILMLSPLALLGCEPSKKDAATSPSTSGSNDGTTKTGSVISEATLTSLNYSASTHSLQLALDYAGCGTTTHSLVFSDVCAESYPRQCGATLERPSSYDTTCLSKQLNHEELTVLLKDEQDGLVLTVKNKQGESKQVLIDRTGRVGAATTPP
ncbi:MAG: hypothetical protein EOP10_25945 [Proteobacteria bacterium]|nr:MAG: hypothetical protein EOP10_25945 [Pseudomonadota bacterium]